MIAIQLLWNLNSDNISSKPFCTFLLQLYDGSPIDHPASPAVIEISLTCHGELKLDVSAPFYYRYTSNDLVV